MLLLALFGAYPIANGEVRALKTLYCVFKFVTLTLCYLG